MTLSVDAEAPSFFDDGPRRWRGCKFGPVCSFLLGGALCVLVIITSITVVRFLSLPLSWLFALQPGVSNVSKQMSESMPENPHACSSLGVSIDLNTSELLTVM